jgi:hypothetical protein
VVAKQPVHRRALYAFAAAVDQADELESGLVCGL